MSAPVIQNASQPHTLHSAWLVRPPCPSGGKGFASLSPAKLGFGSCERENTSSGDSETMLFALGSNGSNQLNLDHNEDVNVPTKCLLRAGANSNVKVVGGGNHTFLRIDDKVYLVGREDPSHLPADFKGPSDTTMLELPNVYLFAATWDAFAVVASETNRQGIAVQIFGSEDKGQLGRKVADHDPPSQDLCTIQTSAPGVSSYDVVSLSGGVQHFVAVLRSGEVIGWGNGRKGQLGEPCGIVEEPRKIQGIDFEVKHAVCGREFTYLLGDSAEGRHLVVGSDKWLVKSKAPPSVKGWKAAGACWGSILVLLDDGNILAWGRNDHGQLSPQGIPPVDDIAVGSEHVVALSKGGQVLAWGWGEHGNCGSEVDDNGDVKGRWNTIELPPEAAGQPVLGLGAGCATSWIWTK